MNLLIFVDLKIYNSRSQPQKTITKLLGSRWLSDMTWPRVFRPNIEWTCKWKNFSQTVGCV